MALHPPAPQRFVAVEVVVTAFAGAPPVDAERLRTDLDAVADQRPLAAG